MDTKASVGFVTLNFNSTKDTIEMLDSICEPDILLYVVVVDNSSRSEEFDSLRQFIESNKFLFSVELIRSDVNLGFSAGNNFACKFLPEDIDYVVVGNNDLVLVPEAIGRLVQFGQVKKAAITTSTICYYNNRNVVWYGGGRQSIEPRFYSRHQYKGADLSAVAAGCRVVTFASGAWMVIDTSYISGQLFDENMFFGEEDADLCAKVLREGGEIWFSPEVVIYHKVGAASNSRKSETLNLYHNQAKIYQITKNYSKVYSVPYFCMFQCYQALRAFFAGGAARNIVQILSGNYRYFKLGLASRG